MEWRCGAKLYILSFLLYEQQQAAIPPFKKVEPNCENKK
jgi:hypothetical protein